MNYTKQIYIEGSDFLFISDNYLIYNI
jgi:hypothetical protein